jgi:hypothetical protein
MNVMTDISAPEFFPTPNKRFETCQANVIYCGRIFLIGNGLAKMRL